MTTSTSSWKHLRPPSQPSLPRLDKRLTDWLGLTNMTMCTFNELAWQTTISYAKWLAMITVHDKHQPVYHCYTKENDDQTAKYCHIAFDRNEQTFEFHSAKNKNIQDNLLRSIFLNFSRTKEHKEVKQILFSLITKESAVLMKNIPLSASC